MGGFALALDGFFKFARVMTMIAVFFVPMAIAGFIVAPLAYYDHMAIAGAVVLVATTIGFVGIYAVSRVFPL